MMPSGAVHPIMPGLDPGIPIPGALRCHGLGNCSTVCPVDVPLREGMQKLKGLLATEDVA